MEFKPENWPRKEDYSGPLPPSDHIMQRDININQIEGGEEVAAAILDKKKAAEPTSTGLNPDDEFFKWSFVLYNL